MRQNYEKSLSVVARLLAGIVLSWTLTVVAGSLAGSAVAADHHRPARASVPAFHHVFVVVMENLDYSSAIATPELASLADRYASATSYYGVAHPSLPNYLAMTSGSTWGVTSDCTQCYVSAPNVFSQLAAAHMSVAAFMEGIASPCFLAPYGGVDYAAKHDPFRYYDDVRASTALCSHIEPYQRLPALLAKSARAVPSFVWVTPNLCDDGHDCPATIAAVWLGRFVTSVTKSAAWHDGGVLFVTWDESDSDDSSVVPPGRVVPFGGGGHVMTLVVAAGLRPGLRVAVPYNHYSLLATVEDAFGLPLLQRARTATPLSAFFTGRAG